MKRSSLPAKMPPRGQLVHSGCSVAAQALSTSSTVANACRRSSVRMVGKMMKKLPSLWRCKASAGRTHTGSNCSDSSATGDCPAGMRATRNGTSKRRGKSRSVIQCASTKTSSAASFKPRAAHWATKGCLRFSAAMSLASAIEPSAWRANKTPSSSKLSRMAAMACVKCKSLWLARRRAWPCEAASSASTPPPGNT